MAYTSVVSAHAKNTKGIGFTSLRTRKRMIARLRQQGIVNESVLNVMRDTPRHIFLDEALAHRAYEDTALPIGFRQTLSQPYIVAKMTELLLATGPIQSVLEVGTGSGYQTAVLAQLFKQVCSIERIYGLHSQARQRLHQLGLHNVHLLHADGGSHLSLATSFDAILVTAAAKTLPTDLLGSLSDGGCMILPMGAGQSQYLYRVARCGTTWKQQRLQAVHFVPMLSGVIR